MHLKLSLLILIASASLVASSIALPIRAGVHPVRCLRLTYGRWTVGDEPLTAYEPLPTTVALLDTLFWPAEHGHPAEYWVVRLPGDTTDRRRAMWSQAGDSLILQFPSWWSSGLRIPLRGVGKTLRGRAADYVDYGPSKRTWARVTAVSVPCPAQIPAPR